MGLYSGGGGIIFGVGSLLSGELIIGGDFVS